MDKDTVVGIVGAVILVAAMVGVFYYEGSNAPGGGVGGSGWTVSWQSASTGGPTANGQTAEGDSTTQTLSISASNLTKIEFTLSWTDDIGTADEFTVRVTPPGGGEARTMTGDTGSVVVTFDGLNEVPSEDEVGGADEGDAQARLAGSFTATGGQGDYVVEITLNAAGDQLTPVGGVVVTPDGGNAWNLAARLTAYASQVMKA